MMLRIYCEVLTPNLGIDMHKTIAMFNHKGGVSKTTTTFNLGWMLAEQGKTVVMIDADPQCNLTGLVVDFAQAGDVDDFYQANPEQNIYTALVPAFESKPEPIVAVPCVEVAGRRGLKLLPGHVNLSEYEVTLGIAQELSGTLQALRNLPGATHYLLSEIAKAENADYVLIDMNPSLGAFNQNLLVTSDFFVVPTAPDYFNLMALKSLSSILPKWIDWGLRAHAMPALANAAYPFPNPSLKLLGTIIQKYRPRKGAPTVGFQKWIDDINAVVHSDLVPSLEAVNATLDATAYSALSIENHCLAEIPDFNTLIALSQENQTPVFALSDEQLNAVGIVLDQQKAKRSEFQGIFSTLATHVGGLTTDA